MNRFYMEAAFDALSEEELDRAIAEKTEEMKAAREKDSTEDKRKLSAQGHRARVKERFRQSGLTGFAPHEIIELLLFYTIPMKDTKPMAHELIDKFGSVAGVLNADVKNLTEINGITENTALLFKLIPQLMNIYYDDINRGRRVTDTVSLSDIFRPYFMGETTEKFLLACLDGELKVLSVTEISRGADSYTSVELKKIMREVLGTGCAMAAIAHNHLAGSPKPTDTDLAITRRIGDMLASVEVKLMDHVIIGINSSYSLRDGGELGIFD